jgi:hypothetical protein
MQEETSSGTHLEAIGKIWGKFCTEVDHLAVLLPRACSTCLKIFLKDKKV